MHQDYHHKNYPIYGIFLSCMQACAGEIPPLSGMCGIDPTQMWFEIYNQLTVVVLQLCRKDLAVRPSAGGCPWDENTSAYSPSI